MKSLDELWRAQDGEAHVPTLGDKGAAAFHPGFRRLAIRSVEDAAWSVNQAVTYQLDNTVGYTVMLAGRRAGQGLPPLSHFALGQARPEPGTGILGSVAIWLGLCSSAVPLRSMSPAAIDSLGQVLEHELVATGGDWSRRWSRPKRGLVLWELPAESLLERHLVLVADQADETVVEQWVWDTGRYELPPLTRYLVQAAMLRYTQAVLTTSLPGITDAIASADAICEDLGGLRDCGTVSIDRLTQADRLLNQLSTVRQGLAWRGARLRHVAATVEVAVANMGGALGVARRGRGDGPLKLDVRSAEWTAAQARTHQAYLDAAQIRATEVARAVGETVNRLLARRQESLGLLQASILGALLMILAGIQSLQYRVPLPRPLVAPVICMLGALAIALPAAVLRWPHAAAGHDRWRWIDIAGVGLFGAAAGWLSVRSYALAFRTSALPLVAGLCALTGALVAVLAVEVWWRRRRARGVVTAHI